jgi:hypothetical protein
MHSPCLYSLHRLRQVCIDSGTGLNRKYGNSTATMLDNGDIGYYLFSRYQGVFTFIYVCFSLEVEDLYGPVQNFRITAKRLVYIFLLRCELSSKSGASGSVVG